MNPVDLAETWLAQLAERATEQNLTFDPQFITNFPALCPVCGQDPRQRQPYPGVELVTYHDVVRHRVIPFWACTPCAFELRQPHEHLTLRIRLRLDEFLPA